MAPGASTSIESTWDVVASDSVLPFHLDLPVDMGPPPYESTKVGISYWLSTLAEFKIAWKVAFRSRVVGDHGFDGS